MKSKKLTKAGGFTIPAEVRRSINLLPGDAVDIEEQPGRIIISAHVPRCFFCESEQAVLRYRGKKVCRSCITEMGDMINESNN